MIRSQARKAWGIQVTKKSPPRCRLRVRSSLGVPVACFLAHTLSVSQWRYVSQPVTLCQSASDTLSVNQLFCVSQWRYVSQSVTLCQPASDVMSVSQWRYVNQPVTLCQVTSYFLLVSQWRYVSQPVTLCQSTGYFVSVSQWRYVTQPVTMLPVSDALSASDALLVSYAMSVSQWRYVCQSVMLCQPVSVYYQSLPLNNNNNDHQCRKYQVTLMVQGTQPYKLLCLPMTQCSPMDRVIMRQELDRNKLKRFRRETWLVQGVVPSDGA